MISQRLKKARDAQVAREGPKKATGSIETSRLHSHRRGRVRTYSMLELQRDRIRIFSKKELKYSILKTKIRKILSQITRCYLSAPSKFNFNEKLCRKAGLQKRGIRCMYKRPKSCYLLQAILCGSKIVMKSCFDLLFQYLAE